jgi:sugar lactone lactonase YvrE
MEAGAAAEGEDRSVVIGDVGFSTPESVLHDSSSDVYLVSNINGGPLEKDDNGFISRVSPDGQVLDLRWIDGADEAVELSAPKGMAIAGDRLYVTDIDCLRSFDLNTGEAAESWCIDGATFLNDVASAPGGGLLFTDSGMQAGEEGLTPSGTDAVYRLSGGQIEELASGEDLGAPNGVAVGPDGIYVVTFGSGEVYRIAEGEREIVWPGSDRQLDGIEFLEDGSYVMSSWGASAVFRVGASGSLETVAEGLNAPADLGYDRTRGRVMIPLFMDDQVVIRSVR